MNVNKIGANMFAVHHESKDGCLVQQLIMKNATMRLLVYSAIEDKLNAKLSVFAFHKNACLFFFLDEQNLNHTSNFTFV